MLEVSKLEWSNTGIAINAINVQEKNEVTNAARKLKNTGVASVTGEIRMCFYYEIFVQFI